MSWENGNFTYAPWFKAVFLLVLGAYLVIFSWFWRAVFVFTDTSILAGGGGGRLERPE